MRKSSSFSGLIFIVIFGGGFALAYSRYTGVTGSATNLWILVVSFILALFASYTIRITGKSGGSIVAHLWQPTFHLKPRRMKERSAHDTKV